MTVTYTREVATTSWLGCFLKLLLRWKGSIYKLIWLDILCYLILYYALNLTYRFALNENQRVYFEALASYCNTFGNLIPVSFVLGFYVTLVANRWWNQYSAIPFPDSLALLISAGIKRHDERSKLIMRTIVRHVCFCFAYTLTMISPRAKRKYPTLDDFVEAGLLQADEKIIIENLSENYPDYIKYWLPLAWAANLVTRARHEGFIHSDPVVVAILNEINNFRTKCANLLDYDWISVPLVYTQVVTLAVYLYFFVALLGRQWTHSRSSEYTDLYFPLLTIFEFFFYVGWLKVAEVLINPFGDDDDDFNILWMIHRHIQVCYLIVDKMHQEHPKLIRDQHSDDILQEPHFDQKENTPPVPSTANIRVGKPFTFGDSRKASPAGTPKLQKKGSWYKKALRNSMTKKTVEPELKDVITDTKQPPNLHIEINATSSTFISENDETDFEKLKEKRQYMLKRRTLSNSEKNSNEVEVNDIS